MTSDELLQVVCTDRGAHKVYILSRLQVKREYGRPVISRVSRDRRYRRDRERAISPTSAPGADACRWRDDDDDGATFTFTCPTCGRNAPLRDDRLAMLTVTDERRAVWRVPILDISHLPT